MKQSASSGIKHSEASVRHSHRWFTSVRCSYILTVYVNQFRCWPQWNTQLVQVFTSVRHSASSGVYLSETLSKFRCLPQWDTQQVLVSTSVRHSASSDVYLRETLSQFRRLPQWDTQQVLVFSSVRHSASSSVYLSETLSKFQCLPQWDTQPVQAFTLVRYSASSGIYLSETASSGAYLSETLGQFSSSTFFRQQHVQAVEESALHHAVSPRHGPQQHEGLLEHFPQASILLLWHTHHHSHVI